MLCDDLEEWDEGSEMGGGFKREEIYIYTHTTDSLCCTAETNTTL